jgi:hypothetical protein
MIILDELIVIRYLLIYTQAFNLFYWKTTERDLMKPLNAGEFRAVSKWRMQIYKYFKDSPKFSVIIAVYILLNKSSTQILFFTSTYKTTYELHKIW